MAAKGLIFFKDDEGNDLKGPREDGSSIILSFSWSSEVPVNYSDQKGRIQGMRKIRPFNVTKEIDQLSPQLFMGLCKAVMYKEILVNLFRIEPETGLEKNYFSYLFKDAHIITIQNSMPEYQKNEDVGQLETVSIIADEVTVTFKEGNIEYTDKPAEHFARG